MGETVNRYLNELKRNLASMPKVEREDAVNEIRSHIAESLANGKAATAILSDLGDAKTLSRAYLSDYHLQKVNQKKNILHFIKSSLFFASTGFASILIVSFFGFLGFITGVFSILMPVFGVMRTFGAKNIFVLWGETQVPSLLGIPTGILLGLIFGFITWYIVNLLRGYFRMITKGYQALLPRD